MTYRHIWVSRGVIFEGLGAHIHTYDSVIKCKLAILLAVRPIIAWVTFSFNSQLARFEPLC